MSFWQAAFWIFGGSASFHLAFAVPALNCLILIYTLALLNLPELPSNRLAFRGGFILGLVTFGPQLFWFWKIFGIASVCLWAVLAFFCGAFVLSLRLWNEQHPRFGLLAAAIFWTGFDYFRSELYFLRFSWLNIGTAFSTRTGYLPMESLGVYGFGFALVLATSLTLCLPKSWRLRATSAAILTICLLTNLPLPRNETANFTVVKVAGVQLEFPAELEIPQYLDRLVKAHSDAPVLVLSEYTLDGPVPKRLRDWCRTHAKYLVIGGKDSAGPTNFYNTAYVVGPDGEIVFKQAKSVPIQFFRDGLPAVSQRTWNSPWGRIGICVCYDLSYRRVTDAFVRDGAQAFIVPFMDVADWGPHQHALHARIGPVRAREYGIPVFRLGSSGISQNIAANGSVLAEGEFPGQGQIVAGELRIPSRARLPIDTWLAPGCSAITAILLSITSWQRFCRRAQCPPVTT